MVNQFLRIYYTVGMSQPAKKNQPAETNQPAGLNQPAEANQPAGRNQPAEANQPAQPAKWFSRLAKIPAG